jgi:hypothetical protein
VSVYNYGIPVNQQKPPSCYGLSYDNDSRECRGCGFQNTCRELVIKAKNNMTSPTTTEYYRQFGVGGGSGYGGVSIAPLRAPVAPMPQPSTHTTLLPLTRPQVFQPQTSQYYQQQNIPPGYPPPVRYGDYGWMQDPLHYAMAGAPTPMRPQMPGESFAERTMKNAGLAMAEALLMQGVLAVRQLVLAPNMPQQEVLVNPIVPQRVSLPVIQIVPESK